MLSKSRALIQCTILALSLFATSASAIPLFTGTPTGTPFSAQDSSGGVVISNGFTVGPDDITVTDLGLWDAGQDGLGSSYDVGIYDAGQTLLASATIDTTSTLIGEFRYESIAPLILNALASYTLAAFYGDNTSDIYRRDSVANINGSGAIASEVTLTGGGISVLENSLTFVSPNQSNARFGPNLLFSTSVPEPGSLALLYLGLAGIGYSRRKTG